MKNKISFLFLVTFVIMISLNSCNKEGKNLVSKISDTESEGMSGNCATCHVSGGNGEGIFTISGTVFDATGTTGNPNGSIKLYTEPNGAGTLIATIEVDGLGNFYTTNKIDFTGGLYPSVTSTAGNTISMTSSILSGQCNSCHGNNTSKIRIN